MLANVTIPAKRPAPRARPVSPRARPRHVFATLCLLIVFAAAPAASPRGTLPFDPADPSRWAQDMPGSNGPPSHNQRAIHALTTAISVVKGNPMRRKSLKRYWPGPRMRRLPW